MPSPLRPAAELAAAPPQPLAITLDEAARLASSSVSTLRRAIAAGELRAAKIGSSVRVRPIDLDAWLAAAAGSDQRAVAPAAVEQSRAFDD